MANDLDVAFPVLSPKDVAALTPRGHARSVRGGEVLWAEGDRDIPFFVVSGLEGGDRLGAVRVSKGAKHPETIETGSLFLFIGADANTGWLRGCVELDRKGFVLPACRECSRPVTCAAGR